ncbi:MAG: transposase [Clostridiales bacterium]|nr:transposase [Clostridiales bacterium]
MEIFKDEQDKNVFLSLIRKAQIIFGFQIYVYSLMSNHYHLQYKDVKKQMPQAIGWIQENYAIYFNAKYDHSGAVFMKPFKSKPVYTRKQFYSLFSYIQNNPVKARITYVYSNYKWNSPLSGYEKHNITDYNYVNHYYEPIQGMSLDEYIRNRSNSRQISELEIESLSDEAAEELFNYITKKLSGYKKYSSEIITKEIQKEIILEAKYQGINSRQIGEFTGVSQYSIQRIKITKSYIQC